MPSVDRVGADAAPWGGKTRSDAEGLDGSASARPNAVLQPRLTAMQRLCDRCAICVRCAICAKCAT